MDSSKFETIVDAMDAIEDSGMPADLGSLDPIAPLHIEIVSSRTMAGYQAAWADLSLRALEPNVFLEPAFALPLLQHVGLSRRPQFLLAWEESGATNFGRLVGLLPIELPGRWHRKIVRGFANEQASLGTPVLDRDRGGDAFLSMLAWLRAQPHALAGLTLTKIVRDGAFSRMLETLPEVAVHVLSTHERAVLDAGALPQTKAIASIASAHKRKELRRQRRRLSETGVRQYASATAPADIARATERFLALEHNGWKGARGTALLADPSLATFVRTMTRLMAHEDKCRIDSLEIDGKPVAMGIVISVGDRAHFWKTAFDEHYASLSPGVQFALDLTQALRADAAVAFVDSCAIPDHPMIDWIWPDRMAVRDLLVDLRGAPSSFRRTVRGERAARAAREVAKTLYNRIRRRAPH